MTDGLVQVGSEDYRTALLVLAAGGRVVVTRHEMALAASDIRLTVKTVGGGGVVFEAKAVDSDLRDRALNALSSFLWRAFNEQG